MQISQEKNNKIILTFPGQGSQYVGMSKELGQHFASANAVYECGSDILGYNLKELMENGDESKLGDTKFSQCAIFASSLISLIALRESGLPDKYAAVGHSLGEYAGLFCCGVIDMETGFKALKSRGEIMAQAANENEGGMVAVIGLSFDDVENVCKNFNALGDVFVANYNSPKQIVISGTLSNLERIEPALKEKGARRIVRLKTSGAFHSPLMKSAADSFKTTLEKLTFSPPKKPFLLNRVDSLSIEEGFTENGDSSIDWASYLSAVMYSPVMFVPQLIKAEEGGYNTFIETGAGKVLTGLVRKTLNDITAKNVEDIAGLEECKNPTT